MSFIVITPCRAPQKMSQSPIVKSSPRYSLEDDEEFMRLLEIFIRNDEEKFMKLLENIKRNSGIKEKEIPVPAKDVKKCHKCGEIIIENLNERSNFYLCNDCVDHMEFESSMLKNVGSK